MFVRGLVQQVSPEPASSIKVADGYTATLFTDANYGGGWANTVTSGDPTAWSGVGNDSVSSLVVQPTAPDSTYYRGSQVQTETYPERFLLVSTGCARAGDGLGWKSLVRSREWTLALRVSFCWSGTKRSWRPRIGSRSPSTTFKAGRAVSTSRPVKRVTHRQSYGLTQASNSAPSSTGV